MTDLEISTDLALAIGYNSEDVKQHGKFCYVRQIEWPKAWKKFDYQDWSIIGPIADRYKAFPDWLNGSNRWRVYDINDTNYVDVDADTSQKAIALAVIGANK